MKFGENKAPQFAHLRHILLVALSGATGWPDMPKCERQN